MGSEVHAKNEELESCSIEVIDLRNELKAKYSESQSSESFVELEAEKKRLSESLIEKAKKEQDLSQQLQEALERIEELEEENQEIGPLFEQLKDLEKKYSDLKSSKATAPISDNDEKDKQIAGLINGQ